MLDEMRVPGRHIAARVIAPVLVSVLFASCVPTPANRPSAEPGAATPSPAGSTSASAAPVPSGPSPSPSFVRPTPTPLPTFRLVPVRSGDTLGSIAKTFGTDVVSIGYWNRATYPSLDPDSPGYRPDRIEVGWTLLVIPNVKLDPSEIPDLAPAASASPT